LLSYYSRFLILRQLTTAMTNVYEQQWQMGRFLKEFYAGQPVAVNDIGAVDYEADIGCVDLAGLANKVVARQQVRHVPFGTWFPDSIEPTGVQAAIVYRMYFPLDSAGLTKPWIRVGDWTIRNNFANGNNVVSFFARDQTEADSLASHLREFGPSLPSGVIQSGRYGQ
jgi:hypothetical protein